jgi:RNA-directed DNA polymerase
MQQALRPHCGKAIVITLDIMDFFPTVTSKVYKAFRCRGATKEVASTLTRLTTCKGRLPQGAPTSPVVAALALSAPVRHVSDMVAGIKGAELSIYVDDIIMSGPSGLHRMKDTVIGIFGRHEFTIHPGKVKVMPQSGDQIALGVRLNNGLEPTTDFYDRLEVTRKELGSRHPTVRGMEAFVHSLTSKSC